MNATILGEVITIEVEARKLERERIMEKFDELTARVMRHVPSGIDTVESEEAFREFRDHVEAV